MKVWPAVVVAIISMAIGGALAFFILGRYDVSDARLQPLKKDVQALQLQVAEVRALASLGLRPDPKSAAQDLVIAAANTVSYPAPSKQEFESNSLTEQTKSAQAKRVNDEAEKLAKETNDEGVKKDLPNCAESANKLKGDAYKNVQDPATIEALKNCKSEIDRTRQEHEKEYKAMGCEQRPQDADCQKKRDQMKKDETLAFIVKVLLIAVAAYLMYLGQTEAGMAVLMLALSSGGSDSGSGQGTGPGGSGTGSSAPTTTVSAPGPGATQGTSTTPPPGSTPAVRLFPGTGGSMVCEVNDPPSLTCYLKQDQSKKAKIDPKQLVTIDADRGQVASYLSDTIKAARPVISFCEARPGSTSNDVVSALILQQDSNYYLIGVEREAGGVDKLAVPRSGTSEKPSCPGVASKVTGK